MLTEIQIRRLHLCVGRDRDADCGSFSAQALENNQSTSSLHVARARSLHPRLGLQSQGLFGGLHLEGDVWKHTVHPINCSILLYRIITYRPLGPFSPHFSISDTVVTNFKEGLPVKLDAVVSLNIDLDSDDVSLFKCRLEIFHEASSSKQLTAG